MNFKQDSGQIQYRGSFSVLAVYKERRYTRMQVGVWVNNPDPTDGIHWWPKESKVTNPHV